MLGDDVDDEYEAKFYEDLVAPGTDEEDNQDTERKPQDIEEYRNKLLSGLTNEPSKDKRGERNVKEDVDADNIDWDAINSDQLDSEDLDQIESTGKIDVAKSRKGPDIQFTTGFGEDIGQKL